MTPLPPIFYPRNAAPTPRHPPTVLIVIIATLSGTTIPIITIAPALPPPPVLPSRTLTRKPPSENLSSMPSPTMREPASGNASTANPSIPTPLIGLHLTTPTLDKPPLSAYASFVRARMWEKSHGYIIEERRRREQERERMRARDEERRGWEKDVEEALQRGEERRRKNKWKDAWGRYERGWERLKLAENERGKGWIGERIPWPVESGLSAHVEREQVERFFKHAPHLQGPDDEVNLGKALKLERVRWHPDKFLLRAGSQGLDEKTIAMVTAVFQIVDNLWSGTLHA
ncbi:MAG: hypothetical protein L6R41_001038 [Letrouitia leprolyta]|nr:MAG: hypothetical protein L6R41_001038 [Letrouitia leprolyta]